MRTIVKYRDYLIGSVPVQPWGTFEWKPGILISSQRKGIVIIQSYTDDTTLSMEEDADLEGIKLGQHSINGEATQCQEQVPSRRGQTTISGYS